MATIIVRPLTFSRTLPRRTSTRRIVLHHTAGGDKTVESIHQMHLARRGFHGIGYHFLIRHSGAIYQGRPIQAVGQHASRANSDSIGIALTGNFQTARPTEQQMNSLRLLIRHIRQRHAHWAGLPVVRHRDVGATACPGRNFPAIV